MLAQQIGQPQKARSEQHECSVVYHHSHIHLVYLSVAFRRGNLDIPLGESVHPRSVDDRDLARMGVEVESPWGLGATRAVHSKWPQGYAQGPAAMMSVPGT